MRPSRLQAAPLASGAWGADAVRTTILALLLLIVGAVYLTFGTLSPCGIVREQVRAQEPVAKLLPDFLIDAAIESKFGAMSPGRCVTMALHALTTPVPLPEQRPAAAAAPPPLQQPVAPQQTAISFEQAQQRTIDAITTCRAKRLRGELKSYLDSAECANTQIIQAFKDAKYRYPDLVEQMLKKRTLLSMQLDRKQITEADADNENKRFMAEIAAEERRRDSNRN